MIPQLTTLKDRILSANTYFDKGFDNVYASEKGILSKETVVFPNDTLGDYFYIRPNIPLSVVNNESGRISDCAAPFAINLAATLVALVENADYLALVNNLLSTLSYNQSSVRSVTMQPEAVIQQELRTMGNEVINNTIANLSPTKTIISIIFELYIPLPLLKQNCLPNPCKTCG